MILKFIRTFEWVVDGGLKFFLFRKGDIVRGLGCPFNKGACCELSSVQSSLEKQKPVPALTPLQLPLHLSKYQKSTHLDQTDLKIKLKPKKGKKIIQD